MAYEGLESVVAAAQHRVRTEWAPGRVLTIGKEDFKSAYKTVAVATKDLPRARSVYRAGGKVQALQLLALPFGAVGSVHGWDLVGETVQWILAEVYGVGSTRYVGDLAFLE